MDSALRITAIAMNAYREAVRARVLYGLLALAFAAAAYAVLVGTLSLHQEVRVVADLGAGSMSMFAALVAIVLGATSLHREIELKTLFPILTRPLRRHEYVIGKYLGAVATLAVFVALDGAVILALLALEAKQKVGIVITTLVLFGVILAVGLLRARFTRVYVVVPWAFALFAAMALLAAPAGPDRQLVLASAGLTLAESAIVAAVATFFAAFSSPFLTAVFSLGIFVVGRSADTLANLPKKYFGDLVRSLGRGISHVVPNLQLYVPPRPLLLGQIPESPTWSFVSMASLHAAAYAAVVLAFATWIFRRRDFL